MTQNDRSGGANNDRARELSDRQNRTVDESFELARIFLSERTPERAELARGVLAPLFGRTVGIRQFQELASLLSECYRREGNFALSVDWLGYASNRKEARRKPFMSGYHAHLQEKKPAPIADDGLRELERSGGVNLFARIEAAREKLDIGTAEQARQARMLLLPIVNKCRSFPHISQVTGMIGEALNTEGDFRAAHMWLGRSYEASMVSRLPMCRYKRLLADICVRFGEFERAADIYRQLLDRSEKELQELGTATLNG